MRPIITVRGLSKDFPLYPVGGPPRSFREVLMRRTPRRPKETAGRFYALRDVSFDVREGEIVGILGRNGAGKSTLLKILARILRPAAGRVELLGRVGSLLEAGTGFHPEMTGRENIQLNAAILGMTPAEIRARFDSIVEFAGVERFVDTPVKFYSTGMYMRLAFSVAAHIEPEILLVDEVLAVGDAAFQKKCLARMEDVSRNGRTVLFVSHDVQTIRRLCRRAILLDGGEMVADGPIHETLSAYLGDGSPARCERVWPEGPYAPGDYAGRLRRLRVINQSQETTSAINISEAFGIEMVFDITNEELALFPVIRIHNEWGTEVIWSTDVSTKWHGKPRPTGRYRVVAWLPPRLLAEGMMTASASLYSLQPEVTHFHEPDAVQFQAMDVIGRCTSRGDYSGYIGGVVRPWLSWTVEYDGS
jgi:lipopolysaccharide transport system ATP-binding protein